MGGDHLSTRATVSFLDVGQGDCTVAIDTDSRAAVLIDCPDGGGEVALQHLAQEGAERITILFLTHLHEDHFGDTLEIARRIRTDEVRVNLGRRVPVDAAARSKLLATLRGFAELEDEGTKLAPGLTNESGNVGLVSWSLLWPTHGAVMGALVSDDPNRASLVVRLEVDGRRFLIAGDSDGRDWAGIRARGIDVHADVLLLPHHGAWLPEALGRMSLTDILDAVGASHHVISVGTTNGYHHPATSTLASLGARASRARVTCTQVNPTCLAGNPLPLPEAKALPETAQIGRGLSKADTCPCAGTVTFTLANTWNTTPSVPEHMRVIDALGAPQCRPVP